MCWSPEQLAARKGDEKIQRGIPAAFVDPPRVSFSSIASTSKSPVMGVVRRVKLPPDKKLVALTFDLCEQPHEIAGYQGAIVDYLREHQIKATFFVGGKWMLTHEERTQQLMADPLFELGNHTWEHRNLRLLKDPDLSSEIAHAGAAYSAVRDKLKTRQCLARDSREFAFQRASDRLTLFRFPFGACDGKSLEAVADQGLLAIQWDVSSGDPWIGQTPASMVRGVADAVRPGSIVLFHANGRGFHTESALPKIVSNLKTKGFEFVTVSELLAAGEPEIATTCYNIKAGDADRYDEMARQLEREYARAKARLPSSPRSEDQSSEVLPWLQPGTDAPSLVAPPQRVR